MYLNNTSVLRESLSDKNQSDLDSTSNKVFIAFLIKTNNITVKTHLY